MGKAKDRAKRAAILMVAAGFVFSSAALILLYVAQNKDATSSTTEQQKALEQLQKQQNLPKSEALEGYSAEPFDKASVTELKVETLTEGDGAAASASSTVTANYFGWTSDGKIFDSSKKAGSAASPIDFPLSGVIKVIKGWTEGLTGVKAGSVVKLTIPADKAYGATGSPPTIGANEPLQFIVELKEVK